MPREERAAELAVLERYDATGLEFDDWRAAALGTVWPPGVGIQVEPSLGSLAAPLTVITHDWAGRSAWVVFCGMPHIALGESASALWRPAAPFKPTGGFG